MSKLKDDAKKNTSKVTEHCKAMEAEQERIDAIMGKAKRDCEPLKQEQAAIKKRAAEDGINKKPFAAALNRRKAIRKANECGANLDPDQFTEYQELVEITDEQLPLALEEVTEDKEAA